MVSGRPRDLNADGSVGGRMAFADAAIHQGNNISGTYTVDTSGRVTLNQIALDTTGVTLTFQLYLDGNGNGFVMGVDQFQVSEGAAYSQGSDTPLSGSYALGAQGVMNGGSWSAVGPVTVTAGAFSGAREHNNNGAPQPAVALTGSQNTASGQLQLSGLSGDTTTGSGWGYYPIDASLADPMMGGSFMRIMRWPKHLPRHWTQVARWESRRRIVIG
jgi:hypothetical protein